MFGCSIQPVNKHKPMLGWTAKTTVFTFFVLFCFYSLEDPLRQLRVEYAKQNGDDRNGMLPTQFVMSRLLHTNANTMSLCCVCWTQVFDGWWTPCRIFEWWWTCCQWGRQALKSHSFGSATYCTGQRRQRTRGCSEHRSCMFLIVVPFWRRLPSKGQLDT